MKRNTYGRPFIDGLGTVIGVLFLSVVLGSPAIAGTTVFEKPLKYENLRSAHFDVNRQLGRAWVDVELTPTTISEYQQPEVVPQMVEGLYYDPARKQVIYRNGSDQVVCAEDWSFLGATALKDTGKCRLSLSSETRAVDDGFRGHQETIGKVVFDANNSGHE